MNKIDNIDNPDLDNKLNKYNQFNLQIQLKNELMQIQFEFLSYIHPNTYD